MVSPILLYIAATEHEQMHRRCAKHRGTVGTLLAFAPLQHSASGTRSTSSVVAQSCLPGRD